MARPAFLPLRLLCVMLLLQACGKEGVVVNRAFYYWQSGSYGLSYDCKAIMDTLGVKKLYLKMFEVAPDQLLGVIPVAKTQVSSLPWVPPGGEKYMELVPTVFIDNEVLLRQPAARMDSLAANIVFLLNKQCEGIYGGHWPIRELQIDCDWSEKTKDRYFELLRRLKGRSGLRLSCTLRLYPFKYRDWLGVPPVDRVMLMCYNLLNPTANPDRNTILETSELEAYLGRRRGYPLPLDIALPVYERTALYRNSRFSELLYGTESWLPALTKSLRPFWHEVTLDTVIGETYLRRGDLIKYERVDSAGLQAAANLLSSRLDLGDTVTVSLFDLSDDVLKRYSHETLDSVFTAFAR